MHNKLAAVAQEPYPNPGRSPVSISFIDMIVLSDKTLNLIKHQDCCTSNTVMRKSLDAGNAKVFDLLPVSGDLFQHQHVGNHMLLESIVAINTTVANTAVAINTTAANPAVATDLSCRVNCNRSPAASQLLQCTQLLRSQLLLHGSDISCLAS
jgi:hypothetical protein